MTGSTVFPQVVLSKQDGTPYDADLPVPVTIAGGASISSGATATAAAPSYTEGSTDALSVNLTGDARVIAKQSGTWTITGTFWQATQPVSGTFWQATQPVSAASLPLPTGAAADATLTGGTQQTKLTDGTNVASVKAASTAAVAADKAVVVAVSPNNSVAVTGTFWQTTQPVSIASMPSTPVTGTFFQATQPVSNAGTFAVQATQSGTWNVGTVTTVSAVTAITNALPAGTSLLGRTVADASAATGGIATTTRLLSAAASTNATSAKASAGRLYSIQGYNAANAVRYLKLYNKASAPTVGTDTPVKTLAIPPGAGFAFDWPAGYSFSSGIAFAMTTGSTDADTGALTSGDVLGLNLDYA